MQRSFLWFIAPLSSSLVSCLVASKRDGYTTDHWPGPSIVPGPAPVTAQVSNTPGTASFTNTVRMLFDVDGNQIDAYGAKINFFDGSYYLYGNSFSINGQAFGIKSYSSNDMIKWAFEGFLFDPNRDNPCTQFCGRPHILYHQKTQKYVLWVNANGLSGYAVATSSSPAKDFVFNPNQAIIDPKFLGLQPADFAVADLGNGEAYLVFSAMVFQYAQGGNLWPPVSQTMHISPLTDDFMNTTGVSYDVATPAVDLIDQEGESPELFKKDGIYYVAASNLCGYCDSTLGLIYRSASIQGPWTRQIISGDSCGGQLEGVLPLVDPTTQIKTYLWHSTTVPGGPRAGWGGHIFQPLQFASDGSVAALNCDVSTQFPIRFSPGTRPPPSGAQIPLQGNPIGAPPVAPYFDVCDSDRFTLIQTWIQPEAGTVKGLSVNIAGSGVQKVPLFVNVFRFSNLQDLMSPGYKYEMLGTATFNMTQLSYVFNAATVPLNATVQAGDHLGFSMIGPDFAPYCHLEYDVPVMDRRGSVLLQQGSGQNSWRGIRGNVSPISVREGKGVRFFLSML